VERALDHLPALLHLAHSQEVHAQTGMGCPQAGIQLHGAPFLFHCLPVLPAHHQVFRQRVIEDTVRWVEAEDLLFRNGKAREVAEGLLAGSQQAE